MTATLRNVSAVYQVIKATSVMQLVPIRVVTTVLSQQVYVSTARQENMASTATKIVVGVQQ